MPAYVSLRTKLVSAFVVLALGPLVAMGFLASHVVTVTHRQDVATMETQLLAQKSSELNRFMEDIAGLFDIRVAYEQNAPVSKPDQDFLLEQLVGQNKYIEEAAFVDLSGQETSVYSRVQDSTRMQLSNLEKLPAFQAARQGKAYYGPVELTVSGPIVKLAGPVLNRKNNVVMVVMGTVRMDYLQSVISTSSLGPGAYVFSLDAKGVVIASTEPKLLSKNLSVHPWFQQLLAGQKKDGLSSTDERSGVTGQQVLAAGVFMPRSGLSLVVEWPTAEAFSVVSSIRAEILWFAFFAIVFVLFLGWLVGRQILMPLALLRQGAYSIGGGRFDYKLHIRTHDEIQDLGEVLNSMGDSLQRLEQLKAAEIREKALAESLAKEQMVSRMKEEFINNTSHQLRTPLTIIRWNYDLLVRAATPQERSELIANMGVGLSQLNMIVRDLIAVSSFGFGYKNKRQTYVDIIKIFRDACAKFSDSFHKKNIAVEITAEEQVPLLRGDTDALTTLAYQVVENAVTYSRPRGTVRIHVATRHRTVVITVSDDGIGIPDEDKPMLFGQFFRARNAIDMKNVGTGLGLFLCKNIAKAHNGSITVRSALGQGTTVEILLPAEDADSV